ncbi:MAG: MBL fold metallo-hydrolase [Deltaproteobacteria bacterium]|nr:MBL fold metallo-hydrolase [Deltaproteobacteria bacterium]
MVTYTGVREVDKVEIVTLQDNYIDITVRDDNAVISRPSMIRDGEIRNSIQAEHGFSAIVRTTVGSTTRTMLFDFGFSPIGAAYNAKALGVPMEEVEVMALSHGHLDHTGGIPELTRMIGRPGIGFVLHPSAFISPRYLKFSEDLKIFFPKLTRESLEAEGIEVIETVAPYPLLGGQALFLGEIERTTDFEKGMPTHYREENGKEVSDLIEDDTAIAMHVRGKGLVVLSGCAHSGIINIARHARKVTGVERVHAVMGGFHLGGPLFESIVEPTTEELKKIAPDYIIPCHCTGRNAIAHMEQAMPDQFILNMSGTKLTFSA